jgi:hypothetical protein
MSFSILRGICAHTKGGEEAVVEAVKTSQRLDFVTKKFLRDKIRVERWKLLGKKSCVCGR